MGPRSAFRWALVAAACTAGAGCVQPAATDRARSLVRLHRDAEATALLRERLAKEPGDVAARRLLVRVLAGSGDLAGARAEAEELGARLPPGDPAPYIELGHAFELSHRYDEALAAYDEAAAIAPGVADGPREGGMRAARWGEAASARPRLEEAIRRGAHDPETWHALGFVRLELGDRDGAEEAYRAGVAAGVGEPPRQTGEARAGAAECWLGLATVAVARADPAGALAAYDEVLARRPRFAPAELGRGWALSRLGRAGEASRALDRAVELGAPAPQVARLRADLEAGHAAAGP
ncbi:MAG: tetratricopeptide repeat protein [Myxococcales bacterium]|nr:tetratricopeptide repeat protein [Myxococcales bacterium]